MTHMVPGLEQNLSNSMSKTSRSTTFDVQLRLQLIPTLRPEKYLLHVAET